MDYDDSVHFSAWGLAAVGFLAWQELWLAVAAVGLVIAAAIIIRFTFRRNKRATDV
jgi:hypothetical protein